MLERPESAPATSDGASWAEVLAHFLSSGTAR